MAVWCFYPLRCQWYISIRLIQSPFSGHWIKKIHPACHSEAPMQPGVSSIIECCLDFVSWKATDTECWTGTCSSKAILLGVICWNVSGTGSYPYKAMPVKDSYLPSVSWKSWHLTVLTDIYGAGTLHPDITNWSCLPHWKWLPIIVLSLFTFCMKLSKYRIYRTFSQNIGQYRTFSKI